MSRFLNKLKALLDWFFRPIDNVVVGVNRYAPMVYSVLLLPKKKK